MSYDGWAGVQLCPQLGEYVYMSTDNRKLLDSAATAAGLRYDHALGGYYSDPEFNEVVRWNPLTDDGDALRLAVGLGLNVCVTGRCVLAHHAGDVFEEQAQDFGGDPCAAARRAIVRAAASMDVL
jgi:hypothetical protein